MVILANNDKEIKTLKDVVLTVNPNNDEKKFSLQIARRNWIPELTYGNYVYVPDTEFGGEIGEVLTNTTLDYVEMKGFTWRGRLEKKIIEPPEGEDYKVVSGEIHSVMRNLIEPEFDGLFFVSREDTGIQVINFRFDRYCTLLSGVTKMLKSVGYRLQITHRRLKDEKNYILIEAVPIIDYSDKIELSKDCRMNYSMEDVRNGVNHLIVTGKGELQERNVIHIYVWPDGSFRKEPYFTGKDEIVKVYENTSTETAELESQSEDELRKLCNKTVFKMNVAQLGIDVGIGDIVGGRDYLTGLYAAKPIENITYTVTNGLMEKVYKLEGEDAE